MTPQELKYSLLQLAFEGKLVTQILGEITPKSLGFDIDDPPFDIPDTWKWQTLDSCCEMYTGNSISESEKSAKYIGLTEGYDYIATKDVSFEQKIEYDNGVRIPFDSTFKHAFKDSVLMCIEGGSAGRKIGILDRDVCFGNKLCMFRANKVLNTFLFYFLQSAKFKKSFSENMTGIIGGVSIKKLKEIIMPIPPLAEQKRIVAKIEELLPYIDRYEQAWNKLENFNKRFPTDIQKSILQLAIQGKLVEQRPDEGTGEELYQQIQTEKERLIKAGTIKKQKPLPDIAEDEIPFDVPEIWKWVRIGEIAHKITDGTHKTPSYKNEGIKFVSAKDISDGKLSFQKCRYISSKEHASLYSRCNPEHGDILVSKSGSIGTVVINDYDFEFSMFESLALIKYDQLLVFPQYLRYSIQNACRYLGDKEIKGVAVKHLPIEAIKKMTIPLPPLAEQKRIVAKLEEIQPLCEKLKR